MINITLPDNYGNVLAVALGAIPFLGLVHGVVTMKTRKAAKILLPHAYASVEQCKADPKAEQFNCAQRAHANFLENSTQIMLLTLVSGLKYPNASFLLGSTWAFFRSLYLYGYVYGGKANGAGRMIGAPASLVFFPLWGMTLFGVAWPAMGRVLSS